MNECQRWNEIANEDVLGLLDGTASEEVLAHLAECDACRDARHELERAVKDVAKAGDDFTFDAALGDRLASVVEEASRERISATRMRSTSPAASAPEKSSPNQQAPPAPAPRTRSRKTLWLGLAAGLSIAASAVIGVKVADHQRSPESAANRAWHGKIAKVARSGADKTGGLFATTPSGKIPLEEGAELKAGMEIATDTRTRARFELDDGSFLVLDRGTTIKVEADPRTIVVSDGAIIADVAHLEKAPWAKIKTPNGDVKVLGTKLAVTATPERTNVEVLRGEVEVTAGGKSEKVSAGQEGVAVKDGRIDVAPANDLAQRASFGEQLITTHNEDTEAPASGLGELRAKKPGSQNEKDHAVHLAKHAVKVRIAGNVARTEIDETFFNDTAEELEGIYRFPLPPGAQIERLALEVDGKLLDGEFIDKAKAAAIWRGAIQNAAPKAPKPREEIVWVPGPWHDPALLEWSRGGRFELKIFPIPKKASRRVVIAYTETVAPVSGVRRYIYPLPQGASSKLTIDNFVVDAQVVGHDPSTPVRARGYELEKKSDSGTDRLSATMTSFTPSGDLAIEYALADKTTDATAWAYTAPPITAAVGTITANSNPAAGVGRFDVKRELAKAEPKTDPIGNDPFVAIALRPKLPKWADTKKRDQVIVIDSGRAMFGERFARAKRLAVQLSQEMDRRDRVTIMACDVACKSIPSGFAAPGATAAHDIDAFLTSIKPDGASDLVGAVRAASNATGHEKDRDLRIVLLSDGVATAGYRAPGRIANEVGESLADARGEVVAVPIGADADTVLLGEVARGGGGVVIPYQPGQRLESTALEVLNATYGTTLRDVELVLPEGLHDAAPARLPPLRAGSETIVTARLRGDAVKGDVVLKGKVGGDPFEAKYAIDVKSTTDVGNAFVTRLFAAARIADRERDATEAQRTELVALSRRFAVPTKFTSLLVLESEAMFKAFGIERTEHAPAWTGESVAQGFVVGNITGGKNAGAGAGRASAGGGEFDAFGADEAESKKDKGGGDDAPAAAKKAAESIGGLGLHGSGAGGGGHQGALSRSEAPAATATAAPATPPAARPAPQGAPPADMSAAISEAPWRDRSRRGGRFMKRIFVRKAHIATDATPAVTAEKVGQARAAVAAAPDERGKHKELAKVLALSGQLEELGEVLEKWSTRDPLDVDAIVARADLAARKGDRDGSLRILGGALAASSLSTQDAFVLATTVARGFERAGRPEACAFSVTAAEIRPTDNDAVARAIACERSQGRAKAAERWLANLKDASTRTAVTTAIEKVGQQKAESATGDIVVSATWDGGADLDIALLDPSGRRAGVGSRLKGTRIEGAQARDHETLGLATSEAGAFVLEMVRAGSESQAPVSGRVTIRAFGQSQTLPFTLTGTRTHVGRVDVRWEEQLVELNDDTTVNGGGPFDRVAAAGALARVSVAHCAVGGVAGNGHVVVTFNPTGRIGEVVVDDANFAGTPAARCIQTAFFSVTVPPFSGAPVRVGKSFVVPQR